MASMTASKSVIPPIGATWEQASAKARMHGNSQSGVTEVVGAGSAPAGPVVAAVDPDRREPGRLTSSARHAAAYGSDAAFGGEDEQYLEVSRRRFVTADILCGDDLRERNTEALVTAPEGCAVNVDSTINLYCFASDTSAAWEVGERRPFRGRRCDTAPPPPGSPAREVLPERHHALRHDVVAAGWP